MFCRGAARLGKELVGKVRLVALRLPMQRERSLRIAKLCKFTGNRGWGQIFPRGFWRSGVARDKADFEGGGGG